MTGEETKRIFNRFKKKVYALTQPYEDIDLEQVFKLVESEIITPYEKQLEQMEREFEDRRTKWAFKTVAKVAQIISRIRKAIPGMVVYRGNNSYDETLLVRADLEELLDELSQNTQTK